MGIEAQPNIGIVLVCLCLYSLYLAFFLISLRLPLLCSNLVSEGMEIRKPKKEKKDEKEKDK